MAVGCGRITGNPEAEISGEIAEYRLRGPETLPGWVVMCAARMIHENQMLDIGLVTMPLLHPPAAIVRKSYASVIGQQRRGSFEHSRDSVSDKLRQPGYQFAHNGLR
jgi:hypothetical protein